MSIPQTKDLYNLVVERNWSLEAAVQKLWPGADPQWWERKLEKFDPTKAHPISKPTQITTGRFAKCNLPSNILGKLNGRGGNGNSGTPAPATVADQRLAARQELPLGGQQTKDWIGTKPVQWTR